MTVDPGDFEEGLKYYTQQQLQAGRRHWGDDRMVSIIRAKKAEAVIERRAGTQPVKKHQIKTAASTASNSAKNTQSKDAGKATTESA